MSSLFHNLEENCSSNKNMEPDMTSSNAEVMPPGTPKCLSPDLSQQEPPMQLHRPSSDRAQDVSHILTSLFQDRYTRDIMSKDTVENLMLSSDGSSKYHKKCMNELSQVHEDHKRKLEEYNMVERHIIQARAHAVSADERALSHIAGDIGEENYSKLGLPPVDSHFRWFVEEEKLKQHRLIVPKDLFVKDRDLIEGPRKPNIPHFALATIASSLHFVKEPTDDDFQVTRKRSTKMNVTVKPPSHEGSGDDDNKTITTLSSDSADLRSIPPRRMISRSHHEIKARDRWRENMKQEARVQDREILARLEKRHNFLKNPRYLPMWDPKASRLLVKASSNEVVRIAGRQVAQEKPPAPHIQVFEAIPSTVVFSDWTVGRVYEAVLELRNVSTVSRHLRVLPPKTSHFSIGLGKYPGREGLVAPGISSQYNVRFLPDALSNYEDEVQVLSQVTEPLVVKVLAKRQPPLLTIGEKIQCGFCLVGGVKVIDLPIKNLGGSGRFCIMKKSMWPAANFKTVVNPGCLDLGSFQIRPSVFEVIGGDSVSLELLFAPEETIHYKEELVIVCDNCQVKYFTIEGEGERAGVELVSVSDGGAENHRVGEISDLTANHLIKFPSLNPHSFYMRQIIVHNSTNVDLPFSWHILKPNLVSALDLMSSEDVSWEKLEFYPDESSSFFVEPQSGTLQPNGIHEFVLTFAPHETGTYNNVLHLVLSEVPDSKSDLKQQVMVGKAPPSVDVVGKLNHEEAAPKMSRSNSMVQSSASKVPSLRKVISLEVEVMGECVPYCALIHPPAVVIPGNVLIGTTVRRPLRMANYSLAPVQYEWGCETSPNIVEVKPQLGLINPGDVADMEVTVTGLQAGPLACNLMCKVEHQEAPISLHVAAQIEGPTVVIDNLSVDFGLIRLGCTPTEKLYIRNTTQLNAQWSLSIQDEENSELVMWPSSGELTSLGQQEVKVTFKPTTCQSLNTCINLVVTQGQGSSIMVRGEVQTPQVCFVECTLVLKETYLSVPKNATAVLINQASFPTAFNFENIRGNRSCEVTVSQTGGVLAPREHRKIEVTFSCHVAGEVTDVYLPCTIEGMENPIVLSFYADIRVLSVEFSTPDHSGPELKVTYPEPVKVGKTEKSRIIFTNLTAIRTPWSATIGHFQTSTLSTKQPNYDFQSVKTRRAMLGRTPNLADPLAKTPAQAEAEHKKLILSDRRGVAFAAEPCRGFLEPYQSQEIIILAYSDMWGKYQDTVTLKVEGIEDKCIPIELNVTGCPLSFQIAHDPDKDTVVRYGTHLEGGSSVKRNLRINNTSSFDIRMDWRTFNYPEEDDKKILDLNVWYGEAFPKKSSRLNRSSLMSSTQRTSLSRDPKSIVTPNVESGSQINTTVSGSIPKLVNVRLEPRLGARNDIPFSMEPNQTLIPAQSHVNVSAIFQPVIGQCNNENGRECQGYALGFMSLDDEEIKEKAGKVLRLDGYSVPPLRLEMTSFVQAGKLHIETGDEDEMTSFQLPLSELVEPDMNLSTSSEEKYLTLLNTTEAVLNFYLTVNSPFYLLDKELKVTSNCIPRCHLKPQTSMQVHVGFRLNSHSLDDLVTLRAGRNAKNVSLERDEVFGTEKLIYRGDLDIRYCNGLSQKHPLVGSVACPSFNVSSETIDFRTTFIGQEIDEQVHLVNRSNADSWWKASIEQVETEAKAGEFRLEPSSGYLQAFDNHRSKNKESLNVFFMAKEEGPCEAVVIFEGRLHEPRHVIKVQACGSLDGQYELK